MTSRRRIETPKPATPKAVTRALRKLVLEESEIPDSGPVGIGFPGVIRGGIVQTAVNLESAWIGRDLRLLAEVRFGAGQGERGLVPIIRLGTGFGSALVYAGHLLPNSELAKRTQSPALKRRLRVMVITARRRPSTLQSIDR